MSATSQTKEIWDLIKETRKDMQETNKQINKLSVETDKLRDSQKKLSVETNEQMKRTDIKLDKFIGDTGNRWGKLGENLIKGSLAQRLKERGIKVEGVITNAKKAV